MVTLGQRPRQLATATATYREMDMGFWLGQAEAALKDTSPPDP